MKYRIYDVDEENYILVGVCPACSSGRLLVGDAEHLAIECLDCGLTWNQDEIKWKRKGEKISNGGVIRATKNT